MTEINHKQKNIKGKGMHSFYLKGDEISYADEVIDSLIISLNKDYYDKYKIEYYGLVVDGSFYIEFSIYS